jgi:adenylosuccinate synthase
MPGWQEDVSGMTSIDEFPINARRYIERIEALAEVPAALLSVGPGREETIILRELFD